ncbi:helix-turn-helix domain-containing protein [Hyphococcus sp.]|uniref:helix-turn-helix domain-containing protein n=1 Tax=Hyphococcus sp. TaxID=2038636 RepID=UPI003D0C492F
MKCTCAFYAYVHSGQWHSSDVANLRENLARNLRARRGKKTQAAFARRIGLHQSSVNRIETERQNVTIDTLQALCDRLRCCASDLLDAPGDK